MCKACGQRLGKHHIEAVKKKEHVLKAVEAGPMASRCWIHPKRCLILDLGGYKSVASKFCANENIAHVLTVAHGLKKRYAKFARAVSKAEAAKSIKFLNLDWEDSQTQELGEDDLFRDAFKFIHEQLDKRTSRSCSTVLRVNLVRVPSQPHILQPSCVKLLFCSRRRLK